MINRARITLWVLVTVLLTLPFGHALAQTGAQVGVFKDYTIPPNDRIEVPIEIRDVQNLYAIDMEMKYDPTILEVEDADPNTAGVQPALGTFLDAGLTLFNIVDPEKGTVRFVMTQMNPSEPKFGNGVIIVVYFRGIRDGESDLPITLLTLSDRAGVEIASSVVVSSIKVETGKPVVSATSIPVQDPTKIVIIPTMAPTDTPAPTPTPTMTPIVTLTLQGTPAKPMAHTTTTSNTDVLKLETADAENPTDDAVKEVTEDDAISLMENWWILVIMGVIIAGVVFYIVIRMKKLSDERNLKEH
jgi:hypothetical protein